MATKFPRGFYVIAGAEVWDRISFTGMRAILVLYMVQQLLLPGHIEHVVGFTRLRNAIEGVTGHLSTQALASQIFGLYVGFSYLTPIFGGFLGDRITGRHRSIVVGALLMTAGHFCMAFEQSSLLALFLIICGVGCMRGNLASQLGDLYPGDNLERAKAFQVYYALINLAAFLAPLITGALAQEYGWHYGFGFAGVGMLLGLVTYVSGQSHIPPDRQLNLGTTPSSLLPTERRAIISLLLLMPLMALYWIAQSQVWNVYSLWVRDHVNLSIAGWTVPVAWLQAVDGLAVVLLVLPVLLFWAWQAKRQSEPDDIAKLGIGCLVFCAGMLWLAASGMLFKGDNKTPLLWAVVFHFISNVGYIYFAPIATGLFARVAPHSVNSLMLGVLNLSIFIGSTVSGRLGGLYEKLPPAEFWLVHALLVGSAGVVILLSASSFRRTLVPVKQAMEATPVQ
jgi:POT family proton-dependent oligopeptide transporter